jgi:hypothetical protein
MSFLSKKTINSGSCAASISSQGFHDKTEKTTMAIDQEGV